MKYLKSYESLDWGKETIPSNVQHDVFDICLELRDKGFRTSYQWWPPYDRGYNTRIVRSLYENNKYPYISINKWPLSKFRYSDIHDVVERLKTYLDTCGYNIMVREKVPGTSQGYQIQMICRDIYGNINENNQNEKSIKNQIIDQVSQSIDDAMLPILDEGFKEIFSNSHSFDIFNKYTRDKKSIGSIKINGHIDNGEMIFDSEEYEHFDHDIVQLLYDSLYMISGLNGIDIRFSFSNFYGDDKILIYTNV